LRKIPNYSKVLKFRFLVGIGLAEPLAQANQLATEWQAGPFRWGQAFASLIRIGKTKA
jgi:hypothetical protein